MRRTDGGVYQVKTFDEDATPGDVTTNKWLDCDNKLVGVEKNVSITCQLDEETNEITVTSAVSVGDGDDVTCTQKFKKLN